MKTIEERLEILEQQLEEIKTLKGIPGPRGAQGPIDACVAQAERMVESRLSSIDGLDLVAAHNNLIERVDMHAKRETDTNNKRGDSLRREMEQFRKDVRESLASYFSAESMKSRIEKAVVDLLVEYWVLDNDMNLLDRNQKPLATQPLRRAGE